MLQAAIEDLTGHSRWGDPTALHAEALRWVSATGDEEQAFSSSWCCRMLSLDAGSMRAALLRRPTPA